MPATDSVAASSGPDASSDLVDAAGAWPRWSRPALWVALGLALIAHLYGLYTPGEPAASEWFPNSDKLLHFLGFGVPATLAVLVFRHWWPIVAFAGNAVLSEVVQHLWLPHRSGDVLDLVADLTGLLPALAVWWFVVRHRPR